MSEEHLPPPPPGESPEPTDEPLLERIGHRVQDAMETAERQVERVEEQVESVLEPVVEHVPEAARRGVRWTVARLVLLILAAVITAVLVITIGVVYYLWNHTQLAAHELTDRINGELRKHSDVELALDGLRGNPLTTVTVLHPRIRFRGDTGPPLVEATAMRLHYSTWDLMWGKRGTMVVDMDHPVVRLAQGPDGKLRIPKWEAGTPSKGKPRQFDFEVHLRDGELDAPGTDRDVHGLAFDLKFATEPVALDLRSLRWRRGPLASRLDQLSGTLAVGDSVAIVVRDLRTPDVALRARVAWQRGPHHPKQVWADIARLRWRWLGTALDLHQLDVSGEGRLTVAAQGDAEWNGRTHVSGVWDDLPVDVGGRFAWRDHRLRVDGLQGTSPAGDLVGRVEYGRDGYAVEGDVRGGDPSRWGVIGIHDWPAGKLDGRFRYVSYSRPAKHAHLDAALTTTEWAGWRADSGKVTVEFPATGPVTFDVRAIRRGGVMTLLGRSGDGSWTGQYTLHEFPLDEWPDGRATGLTGTLADGSGGVVGHSGALDVTGTLNGRSTDWFGAHTASWTLTELHGRLLPLPDLDAKAQLENLMFLRTHFDHVAAPFHLGDRRLAMRDVEGFAGDTLITLDGDAAWDAKGAWDLTATRAEMKSGHFDWNVEPPMVLHGSSEGVGFERFQAHDQGAHLTFAGLWGVPGGRWDFRADASRLDLSRLGMPGDLGLEGVGDATLAIQGPVGEAHWTLAANAARAGSRGRVVDSLEIRTGGGPSALQVDHARAWVAGGTVDLAGRVADMKRPWADTLTAPGVIDWVATAGRWEGDLEAHGLSFAGLAKLAPALEPWRGTVGGTVHFSGSPGAPELAIATQVAGLGWRDLAVDSLGAVARFRGERLEIERLGVRRGGETWRASGAFPVQLAFARRPVVPDQPVDLELKIPNGDLRFLPLVVPQVGLASGVFDLDARLGGSAKHPDVSGTLHVRNGRVRLAGREEIVDHVDASLRITPDGITLDSLNAIQNTGQREGGTLAGHGLVRVKDGRMQDYRFQLALRNFRAVDPAFYVANFDGDFTVTNGPRVNGQVIPFVTSDDVHLRRALVFYDFANQTADEMVAVSTQPLQWVYDLHVKANNNLHWTPSNADIEFDADLNVQQTLDSLLVYGDMHAIRGWYDFLSNRFTVNQADLTFDNVGGLDPNLDVAAVTRVNSRGEGDATSTRYTVTVTLKGRSKAPDIEFTSDPANLDEAAILQALTIGQVSRGNLTGSLDDYLTRRLSQQLSGEMRRVFRGYLDEWEINRGEQGDLTIGVGTPVTRNVTVRYRQRFGTVHNGLTPPTSDELFDKDIEAEYRLNRFIYLTSGLAQRRSATTSANGSNTTPEYNVAIKARWEY